MKGSGADVTKQERDVLRAEQMALPVASVWLELLDDCDRLEAERDEARAVLRALVAALPQCDECARPSLLHPFAHGPSVCAEHGYQETIGAIGWVDMQRWAAAITEAERVL